MNPKQSQPVTPPGSISVADVYYILFKRKWLILICAICGFIAAGVAFSLSRPAYESTAKLFINYIVDTSHPGFSGNNSGYEVREAGAGASIINSEIQIMTSFDSAKKVANVVGPAKILAPYGGGTNEDAAAVLIMSDLVAVPVPGSQIVALKFTHRDFSIVQQVLELVITNYQQMEEEVHQSGQSDADLLRQKGILASQSDELDRKLADAYNSVGVVQLDTALAQFQSEQSETERKTRDSEIELAKDMKVAELMKRGLPASDAANSAAEATNSPPPPQKIVKEYKRALNDLNNFQDFERALLVRATPEAPTVKIAHQDVTNAQAIVDKLEEDYPALTAVATTTDGKSQTLDPKAILQAQWDQIEVLKTTISNQVEELQRLRVRGTNLVQTASIVEELKRQKNDVAAELEKLEGRLRAHTILAEETGKVSGVTPIEIPTPPARDLQKAPKLIAGLGVGGIALGLGLAFLLELVLDRSFKRPHEITSRLKLPFFLTIPYMNGKMKMRLPAADKVKLLTPGKEDSETVPDQKGGALTLAPSFDDVIPPWDEKHALRPFHETLRDRLVAYFEEIGLTHKPKLVAVTSCDEGAGVSTIASGLASSLSETGEGNVLLVSMNSEDGAAHHFYKGRLELGIDEVLHKDNRSEAMVQDKLYVVKESSNSEKLPSFLPKRFGHLVDKMKASDYDYIIFDMPPVTQISVTPRLARFMDTVLLVVEAEKTHHDVAQRAAALLVQSRANVGVVMNKTRSYVPKRLLQEL